MEEAFESSHIYNIMKKIQITDLLVRLIKEELDMGRFRHNEINFRVTKFPQNVHKICFLEICISSICNLKIELITYAPHHVNYFIFLQNSYIVHLFDFWHIIYYIDPYLTIKVIFFLIFRSWLLSPQSCTVLFFILFLHLTNIQLEHF